MDSKVAEIALKGWNRERITKEECRYVLGFSEKSEEAMFVSSLAERFLRENTGNTAIFNTQIGVQVGPCPGNCRFCNFNVTTTKVHDYKLNDDELSDYIKAITKYDDVRTISLMTMHNFDFDHLVHAVKLTRRLCRPDVNVTLNTGDLTYDECVELRKAGANGAYHSLRLREGIDNDLDPNVRMQTLKNYLDAGFVVSTCTGPIGVEHSIDEILDNYFLGMEMGFGSGSVMARVPVPGTPLASKGMICMKRIEQIRGMLFLAGTWYRKGSPMDIWNTGYFNGYNRFTSEYGGNPRDSNDRSEEGQGHTVEFARRMAFNRRYARILRPDNSIIDLDIDYLKHTGSL